MRAVVVSLLLLSGCDALFNLDHIPERTDAGASSDGHDADVVDADTQNICFGTGRGFHPKFCYPASAPIPPPLNLSGTVSTDSMCDEVVMQAGGTSAICIIKAQAINVTSSLRVVGGRPLVLLSRSQLAVAGLIDASSNVGGTKGAGANTSGTANPCTNALIDGNPGGTSTGGGGGAGGSFAGGGGNGGTGDMSIGGIARPADDPVVIRGGCNGGKGGPGGGVTVGGTPGAGGGGAVYLASATAIVVTGAITVNGAGGAGGVINFGGAGGGGGGMIVLDAPTVTVSGSSTLQAVGGGGGQGGGKTDVGENGQDGPISAGGVNSNVSGGIGGNGSHASGQSGSSGSGGGGGGGGGGGYIAIASPVPMLDMSGSYRPMPVIQ